MFLMYSWNAMPLVNTSGCIADLSSFWKKPFCLLCWQGNNFQSPTENQTGQFPRQPQQELSAPLLYADLNLSPQVLHGHTGRANRPWYLLSSLPTKPKEKHKRCLWSLHWWCLSLLLGWPPETQIICLCAPGLIFSVQTLHDLRGQRQKANPWFVYTTNHQFDFWPWTKFCCFTALDQHKIKCLQRNCYSWQNRSCHLRLSVGLNSQSIIFFFIAIPCAFQLLC